MGLTCREITDRLEQAYPAACAEEWDNVGLLVGRLDAPVENVYIALDLTGENLDEALEWGADLIVTHHPMIFKGMKRVNDQDFIGRKILRLAESHTACYAMHTNFDVLAMADINERLLELKDTRPLYETGMDSQGNPQGIGRIGTLPFPMTLKECARYVKERFGLPSVKAVGDLNRMIHRAAVSGGAGKSMVSYAISGGAQALITGDIDHHTGLDAADQGLCIIDAGHYGTEYFFISHMKDEMERMFSGLQIRCAGINHPFADIR